MSLCKVAVIARSPDFQPVLSLGHLHLLGMAWVGFEHEQVTGCAAAACDNSVTGS